MVKNITGMHQQIDLALQHVGDCRLETGLEIDGALVAPGDGVSLPVGRIAKMGVGNVGNANARYVPSHCRLAASLISLIAEFHGFARGFT